MLFLLNFSLILIVIILLTVIDIYLKKRYLPLCLIYFYSYSVVELHTSLLVLFLLSFHFYLINIAVNFVQGIDGISMLFIVFSASKYSLCLSSFSIIIDKNLILFIIYNSIFIN